jgi:hypothetical protein
MFKEDRALYRKFGLHEVDTARCWHTTVTCAFRKPELREGLNEVPPKICGEGPTGK